MNMQWILRRPIVCWLMYRQAGNVSRDHEVLCWCHGMMVRGLGILAKLVNCPIIIQYNLVDNIEFK